MGVTAALFAVSAASNMMNAYTQSEAIKSKGKYEQQVAESNARFLDLQAEDSLNRGEKAASRIKREAGSFQSSQRAGYAGQNVDVNSGAALEAQLDTAQMGELDALTVKNNAWREAWGYKTQAINERGKGRMARLTSKTEANQTLINGGFKMAQDLAFASYAKGGSATQSGTGSSSYSSPSSYGARSFNYGNKLRLV